MFQPSILNARPDIIALLKHNDNYVCQAGAQALSVLSKQGKSYDVPVLHFSLGLQWSFNH